MSLSLYHIFREMSRPLRMFENHLRLNEELFNRLSTPLFIRHESEDVIDNKEKFEVKLNMEHFKPEEIQVKTSIDENCIKIEAKHEEKQDDHGFVSREYVRKFLLPKGLNLKEVVSKLSSDGVLTVTAPKVPDAQLEQEKVIPVTFEDSQKKE